MPKHVNSIGLSRIHDYDGAGALAPNSAGSGMNCHPPKTKLSRLTLLGAA